jgi:hypothetical protein
VIYNYRVQRKHCIPMTKGLVRSFFAPTLKYFAVGYELTSAFPGIPERAHPHHFYGRSGDPHPHPGSHAHALSESANKYFLDPARASIESTHREIRGFLIYPYKRLKSDVRVRNGCERWGSLTNLY